MESLPAENKPDPETGGTSAPGPAHEETWPAEGLGGTEPGAAGTAHHAASLRLWGVGLGAAAIGGLMVWMYLRSGSSPQAHVSHRLDEVRHRLEELSNELARYASHEQGQAPDAG